MFGTRLLALLLADGCITPVDVDLVLGIQADQRITLDKELREKCGEIVVRLGLAAKARVDTALQRQRELRRGFTSLVARVLPTSIDTPYVGGGAALVVAAIAAAGWWKYGFEAAAACTTLGCLGVAIARTLLLYCFPGKIRPTLGYALGAICVIALLLAAAAVVQLFGETATVSPPHTGAIGEAVKAWYLRIRVTVLLLIFVLVLASVWALVFKRSARFARARAGVLKDMMIRVGDVLRATGYVGAQREEQAVKVVLDDLRAAMCLRAGSWWRWLLRSRTNAMIAATTVYLVPDRTADGAVTAGATAAGSTGGQSAAEAGDVAARQTRLGASDGFTDFRIFESSWYPKVEKTISDMFHWMKKNYRPLAWNESLHHDLWEHAKKEAQNDPQVAPKEIYRRQKDHARVGSLTGWIFSHGKVAMSNDATKHENLMDPSEQLQKLPFQADIMQWAKVRSFIGCPVPGSGSQPQGVLLALKTVRDGFDGEDSELVVAAAQLIASITNSGPRSRG